MGNNIQLILTYATPLTALGSDIDVVNDKLQELALKSDTSSPSLYFDPLVKRIDLGSDLVRPAQLAYRLSSAMDNYGDGHHATLGRPMFLHLMECYEEHYPTTDDGQFKRYVPGIAPVPWKLGEALLPAWGGTVCVKHDYSHQELYDDLTRLNVKMSN